MKLHRLFCAASVLALSTLPMTANAQSDSASTQGWTAANVDTSNPFGTIDVTAAGSTAADVGTFASGLSGSEVVELLGRCNVVLGSSGGMGGMGLASAGGLGTTGTDLGSGTGATGDMSASTGDAATSGTSADVGASASTATGTDDATSGMADAGSADLGIDQSATASTSGSSADSGGSSSAGAQNDQLASAGSGAGQFDTTATTLCRNLNAAVFGSGMASSGNDLGTDGTSSTSQ